MHSPVLKQAKRSRVLVKITANMITILRIVLMPIPGYLLYGDESHLRLALFLIIILGLTDWLDGVMARKEGPSVLGGLLDPIADKIFIAVIYLPLTDLGVIPIWLTAAIFARDFVVTALRTSLSLRDAPMRTATLAKYKTAMQMVGIGYVIFYLSNKSDPDALLVWFGILCPIAIPLSVIVKRLLKKEKQGPRSVTMFSLMSLCVVMWVALGPAITVDIIIYVIGAITVVSGFSYLIDAWSALKGKPGRLKEGFRFLVEGVLAPVLGILLLNYYDTAFMSAAIILIITLDLAIGGLDNLLASQKIIQRFWLVMTKSLTQSILAACALVSGIISEPGSLVGEGCITLGLILTTAYAVGAFVHHRQIYLSAL
jgi:cardiolipin synthase (CMP-forming)